jgi:hypothetical protein
LIEQKELNDGYCKTSYRYLLIILCCGGHGHKKDILVIIINKKRKDTTLVEMKGGWMESYPQGLPHPPL